MIEATNIPGYAPEEFIEEMHAAWIELEPIRTMDPAFPSFGAWIDLMWMRETGASTERAIGRENLHPSAVNPWTQADGGRVVQFQRPDRRLSERVA